MPLYNVTATKTTTMVVLADDENHAWDVAQMYAEDAFMDTGARCYTHFTGEVRSKRDLRDGWDETCFPYGGDDTRSIGKILGAQDNNDAPHQ